MSTQNKLPDANKNYINSDNGQEFELLKFLPHENQTQMKGWRGWNSIYMITTFSSQ